MVLFFDEDYMPKNIIIDKMIRAGEETLRAVGVDHDQAEISITFVSAEEIMELNSMYRNRQNVTDVLSFAQFESLSEIKDKKGQALVLGDVVIAPDIAFVQAEEYGHTIEREIVYLFVHSVLHLLCFDHETDAEREAMRIIEEDVMKEIGLGR